MSRSKRSARSIDWRGSPGFGARVDGANGYRWSPARGDATMLGSIQPPVMPMVC